ncbi:MAG: acyl-CoA dehydrogenase family protein [Chloroflexi bacterium]|nr:acyl-CoA dehydrogenase family protein [Chloroflexota bacterium]
MNFTPTAEQLAIKDKAREFAEKVLAPTVAERDEKEEFRREIFDMLGEAGLAGINIPKNYGGLGLDMVALALATEELSRIEGAWGLILPSHTVLAGSSIAQNGTEEQKQKYLVPMAKGTKLACFSITEAGAGSDAGGMTSTAVLAGEHYVLNGKKIYATNGGEADVYVIFAYTDKTKGTRGISAFIVEKDTPGLSFGPKLQKLGVRSSVQREIFFENCNIPRENLLGQEGQGFRIALGALDGGRAGIAAQGVGLAQGAYEVALTHTKKRVQFGNPLSEQQSIRFMLADMATEIEAARLLTLKAAFLLDQGQRASKEAAMAKTFATDVAMRVSIDAVQLLGGVGVTKFSAAERFMRDAKVTQIYEGTNQVMKIVISAAILR